MLVECDVDTYLKYMEDDPVRAGLFADDTLRFSEGFHVFADVDEFDNVNAILCAVISPFVLQTETLLREVALERDSMEALMRSLGLEEDGAIASILTPYSLWSYKRGSGRRLIKDLLEYIPIRFPQVTHVITMSPQTVTAMKFHLRNGAMLLSPNKETINYEYILEDKDVCVH